LTWHKIDLHLHTPASSDYQQPEITYLDILQKAEAKGLSIIAFTDHNTITGYAQMQKEIEELNLLKRLNRLNNKEKERLDQYTNLLDKILVLPGFEFTAAFGFHILGIFSPNTPIRNIEHILLKLQVPFEQLDKGATEVGATADVLTAYREINQAGGLVVAAHANSNHGVAMQGLAFGGQTKIAYTQDPSLHALEVTDLESQRRRTTANFYDGAKSEYPRRMHCIQGSDAHRLVRDDKNKHHLGVGDRVTEVLLPEVSFNALLDLFKTTEFNRTRPYRRVPPPEDRLQSAKMEGDTIIQSFREEYTRRGGHLYNIISDICAFANTNGGSIYIGLSADPNSKISGVAKPKFLIKNIFSEMKKKITPSLYVKIETIETSGKKVLFINVFAGNETPYTIGDSKIYVRADAETRLAERSEIIALVKKGLKT
jgi:hypothetical protein